MAKKSKHSETGTGAILALQKAGITPVIHTYEHDERAQAWGLEAAQALGLDPARVFKTLLVSHEKALAVVVIPVASRLDLKAIAKQLGWKKAQLADPALAQRTTGYVVGGISPLGQKKALPTLIDASAATHETVFVSGGRRGLDLELDPQVLAQLTKASFAEVAK
ncbi:YbaK/EbsC protein [Actinomyces graevenitzii F0530]|mgnify:FL=1|jgi:ybaK/ebsC protein|uniref:Cys-tRNA(Pro)/Cys-tRNA(Cys) deacylase n=1 Tax=Actinomyces graevenitzii F0530 TaxID=1321817 RepID=U1PXV4_9ACTO|nr:Cys-tRNA(Pro) deacylase [Actinomyces graevenitzii]ERH15256.1 YbaK/EbsC protein [Actinomyces graevenitzii F0530]MBF0971783.1 Cys-tRNA(Pro) deacylase [Actinomyces graevenitzii]